MPHTQERGRGPGDTWQNFRMCSVSMIAYGSYLDAFKFTWKVAVGDG